MSDRLMKQEYFKHPVADILEGLSAHLKFLSELGCAGLVCSDQSLEIIQGWGADKAKNNSNLFGIYNNFIKCRNCSLLKDHKQIVCGDGPPEARLVIVGGVAGPDDVREGKPYGGKAGELLNKMIAAMNLTRDQIYITRAVKCCLPDKQKPKMVDINICKSYLDKELRLVKPDIICAFGEVATMSLLETSIPLSRLRGRFHDYKGMRIMPTYSPAYLLENKDAKREVWEDLKQVIAEMEKLTYT